MLRQKLRAFVLNSKNHGTLVKLARLLIVVGILWLLSFPYIARNVFTSENALDGFFLETQFDNDGGAYSTFKTLQDGMRNLPKTGKSHRDFILGRLGPQAEVHIQQLRSAKDRQNIYAYVRSQRGYGNECVMLALPLNHRATVVTGLAFIETVIRRAPKW